MNSHAKYIKNWRELKETILKSQPQTIIIISHENADLDAIASTILLKSLLHETLRNFTTNIHIILSSIKRQTKKFLEKMNLSTLLENEIQSVFELPTKNTRILVILTDISDPQRFVDPNIRTLIKRSTKIIAIDHHKTFPRDKITIYYKPYTSTTEILLDLIEQTGLWDKIMTIEKIRIIATAAIITDTAFFNTISPKTFYFLSKLATPEIYTKIHQELKTIREEPPERPEILAILKALQRLTIFEKNGKIFTLTHIGSYETKVANTLLKLGANTAIVISPKKEHKTKYVRIIIRSKDINILTLTEALQKNFPQSHIGILNPKTATIQIFTTQNVNKIRNLITKLLKEVYLINT